MPTHDPLAGPHHTSKESVKETLLSIIIAFVLAFVFRGFVVEAFVIPTGSMAPTLYGAHMRFRGENSGYTFAVNPWETDGRPGGDPLPVQALNRNIVVHDPMTGQENSIATQRAIPVGAGDRILVQKYLYAISEPRRWDVVVFKCPYIPDTNFIKRLIGLPGEELALVDGDVFTRPAPDGPVEGGRSTWEQDGWRIQRKPARTQRAVWMPVFDSAYTPASSGQVGMPTFTPPWIPRTTGWNTEGRTSYEYTGDKPTTLEWATDQDGGVFFIRSTQRRWGPTDWYPYDESPDPRSRNGLYPVSDVRLRAAIKPLGATPPRLTACLDTRGRQFRAELEGGTVTIKGRPKPSAAEPDPRWESLATGSMQPLTKDRVTNIEFWHHDQTLQVWVEGDLAASAEYGNDWTPAKRFEASTGTRLQDMLARDRGGSNIIAEPSIYGKPGIRWEASGGPFEMFRVALDRDLYYQPGVKENGVDPLLATTPRSNLSLKQDQFFCCGDNSPASADGRAWATVDPWVARDIDGTIGIVPRKLMLGKAFFVYFPALLRERAVPAPDFGTMRFIR